MSFREPDDAADEISLVSGQDIKGHACTSRLVSPCLGLRIKACRRSRTAVLLTFQRELWGKK